MTRAERYVREHLVSELAAVRRKGISRVRNGLTVFEKCVVYYYTDSGYDPINTDLRADPESVRKMPAALLLAALKKLKPFYGEVHRTLRLPLRERRKFVPAAVVSDPTFVSASRSPLIAKLHPDFNVRFQILSKTGRYIKLLSAFPEEDEVLFLPGTKFKILSVTERADYLLVKLEEE